MLVCDIINSMIEDKGLKGIPYKIGLPVEAYVESKKKTNNVVLNIEVDTEVFWENDLCISYQHVIDHTDGTEFATDILIGLECLVDEEIESKSIVPSEVRKKYRGINRYFICDNALMLLIDYANLYKCYMVCEIAENTTNIFKLVYDDFPWVTEEQAAEIMKICNESN